MIKMQHINALESILNETFGRTAIRDSGHAIIAQHKHTTLTPAPTVTARRL